MTKKPILVIVKPYRPPWWHWYVKYFGLVGLLVLIWVLWRLMGG